MIAEGGYSDHPADRGGETYRGISRNANPHWLGWPVIDSYKKSGFFDKTELERELKENDSLQKQVLVFYAQQHWHKLYETMDQQVCDELFDTSVNMGREMAVMIFQKALNALNRGQKDYPNSKVDGAFGPLTLAAYRSYIATSKYPTRDYNTCVKVLVKMMNYFQMDRYLDIITLDESQEEFMYGWSTRA